MKKLLLLFITLISASLAHAMEKDEQSRNVYLFISCDNIGLHFLISHPTDTQSPEPYLTIPLPTIPEIDLVIPKPTLAQTTLGTIARLDYRPLGLPFIDYQTTKDTAGKTFHFNEKLKEYSGGTYTFTEINGMCPITNLQLIENQDQARAEFDVLKKAFDAAFPS